MRPGNGRDFGLWRGRVFLAVDDSDDLQDPRSPGRIRDGRPVLEDLAGVGEEGRRELLLRVEEKLRRGAGFDQAGATNMDVGETGRHHDDVRGADGLALLLRLRAVVDHDEALIELLAELRGDVRAGRPGERWSIGVAAAHLARDPIAIRP